MAEDWLKWTYGLAGKREIRVISSRCHRDRHEIAARAMSLWEWLETNLSEADIDSETGDASLEMGENWKAQIDEIAGLSGFAEALASTDVNWLIPARSSGRVTFPRLGRHIGKLAKTRAVEARKKQRQRKEKCPGNNGTNVPPPSGPEKEKEEIYKRESEGASASELLPKPQAAEQAFMAGVPKDFAEYVYDDWFTREGRDAGGVAVSYVHYTKKRWTREGQQWDAGTHKGKKAPERTEAKKPRQFDDAWK